MTIDETIKELELYNSATFETRFITFSQALQLGIEALTRLQWLRLGKKDYHSIPLPGETKD